MTEEELPGTCCDPPSRREARREERRECILEVATRCFREHGYAGTTMSAIAARLGGSKGTLWSYYASKELLFGDVLDRQTREFRERLGLILTWDGPTAATLEQVCYQFLVRITDPDAVALHRLVLGEAGRLPEMGRIFYKRVLQRVQQQLSDFIASAMDRGDLRQDDPAEAANALIALTLADYHRKLITGVVDQPPEDRTREQARSAVDKFMRAYR